MPVSREVLRLTSDELDQLLSTTRTLRAGTVSPDGWPHVAPLWFVWRDGMVWINSLKRSRRTRDVQAGSPVALCIDDGFEYAELRGAVLYGRFVSVPDDDPDLPGIREAFGEKYFGGVDIPMVRSHQWLRLRPERIVSWDFKKIPTGADRRLEARYGGAQPGQGSGV